MEPWVTYRDYPEIVSTKEACKILNVSRSTVYRLLKKKKIEAFKTYIGRNWLIPKRSLFQYLELKNKKNK